MNHTINELELELELSRFHGQFRAYSSLDTRDERVSQRRDLELLLADFSGRLKGLKAFRNLEMDCTTLTNMLDKPMHKLEVIKEAFDDYKTQHDELLTH